VDVRHRQSRRKPVNTLMYTDGLATFSVFVEELPSGEATGVGVRNGATIAVSERVRGANGGHALVTLVGELPEQTARRIARSVFYGEAP